MTALAAADLGPPHRTERERHKSHEGLAAFGARVFGYLPRSDQRRWAATYLRGLLATPGRKTVRRMDQTLALADSAPQALQQFITTSPWDWTAVRVELARITAESMPGAVWTAAPVLLRKRGDHSVGLHRRLVPGTGRWVNCQVGIGLFLTSGRHSLPVAWRLLLNDTWCGDPERRSRTRIPSNLEPRAVGALVLEMIDEFTAAGVAGSVPLVHSHGRADDARHLAAHLTRRRRDCIIEVVPEQQLSTFPPGGTPSTPALRQVSSAAALAEMPRCKSPPTYPGHRHLYSAPVRFAGIAAPAAQSALRLVAEVSSATLRDSRFWVTSLHGARPTAVHALAHRTAVSDATVRHMQNDLGLMDFKGRSFGLAPPHDAGLRRPPLPPPGAVSPVLYANTLV
ncbi:transposase [Streptomyces decoyicus]|uniref:IS701 family transposase n=1 Tax=Streptomyces decoyicus TaxID=249567 RepID=UPI00386AE478